MLIERTITVSSVTALNLSKQLLEDRLLQPYRQGATITLSGRSIEASEIWRVRIFETESREVDYMDHSHVFEGDWGPPGIEVTDQYISGPPGISREVASDTSAIEPPSSDSRDVFVVHGRNEQARDVLFAFLRAIGLHPLEWSEVTQATGKPTPYIGEILDTAFSRAHAVIVLFTPDDEARLKEHLWEEKEHDYETVLAGQARPNVLFEAGMAMGRNNEQTVLVELGQLRRFSDIEGLHVVRLDGSTEQLQELARRLETAGCPVNWDGIDEQSAGDFEAAINLEHFANHSPPSDTQNRSNSSKHLVLNEHYGGHNVLPPELAARIPLYPRVPESSDSMWLSEDGQRLHNGDNVYIVCSTLEEARERSREVGVQTAWYDENYTSPSSTGEIRRGSWIWNGSKPAREPYRPDLKR